MAQRGSLFPLGVAFFLSHTELTGSIWWICLVLWQHYPDKLHSETQMMKKANSIQTAGENH